MIIKASPRCSGGFPSKLSVGRLTRRRKRHYVWEGVGIVRWERGNRAHIPLLKAGGHWESV